MSDKNFMQLVDKTTRNRVFNSRYWKEECFALNAETIIDKAIALKYIGGLYSGAKKPTKFLCLFLKMLQMNLPKDIVIEYLKARQYKYLNVLALLYLRFTLKVPEVYEMLEAYYVDNRKIILRNSIGKYELTYIDEIADKLLNEETYLGIVLPFITKRLALELQQIIEPRTSLIEQNLDKDQIAEEDEQDGE